LVDHDYFKAIDEETFLNKIVIDTRGVLFINKKEVSKTFQE